MPVDAGSAGNPDGNLAVWDHHGELRCRVLTAGEQLRSWEFRGVNHWATCTKASEFKPQPGWSLSQRHLRWEYRDPADLSHVVCWYHVARVAELVDEHGWDDAQLVICGGYGVPDMPDEARPVSSHG
jgi:hypothetical protein